MELVLKPYFSFYKKTRKIPIYDFIIIHYFVITVEEEEDEYEEDEEDEEPEDENEDEDENTLEEEQEDKHEENYRRYHNQRKVEKGRIVYSLLHKILQLEETEVKCCIRVG